MSKNKEYRIETISDVLKIPEDKIENFLVDLKTFFVMCKNVEKMNSTFGVKIAEPATFFTWIDDGKNEANINVKPSNLNHVNAVPGGWVYKND
jgi:hypothetical protein